jgi:hypothetical protein
VYVCDISASRVQAFDIFLHFFFQQAHNSSTILVFNQFCEDTNCIYVQKTPTARWSLMCSGRVVQDRSRQQHRNGPVVGLYLWKEWNTRTEVDSSST